MSPKLSTAQIDEICARYATGLSSRQVARALGTPRTTIRRILNRRGLMRSRHQSSMRCTLDESAFSEITEESAYWCGFLMADGCVLHPKTGSPLIKLELAAKDLAHIEKFRQFLGSSHKIIKYVSPPNQEFGPRAKCYLKVSSAPLAAQLAAFGVVPRKANAQVKQLEMNRDFWRGVFDGDASISKDRCHADLCGHAPLLEQFVAFVQAHSPGFKGKLCPTGTIFRVNLYGQHACQILALLYDNCSVALDRKLSGTRALLDRHCRLSGSLL